MMRRKLVSISILVGLSCCATGCSTVPHTGRKQLIFLSTQQEVALGAQAYKETLAKEKRSDDVRMTEILQRVGHRIAAVAERDDFEWEFNLIESKKLNAFCLPGGKVAVYTGILSVMKNEAGMAAVIGHEVAHAIARHGAERVSQAMTQNVAEKILEQGLSTVSPETRALAIGAFGAGAAVGVMLPYSRTHELEADQIGILFAARAGYDPREAPTFWQRMADGNKKSPPEFLSTHPAPKNRIKKLEGYMPKALEAYEQAGEQHGIGETW